MFKFFHKPSKTEILKQYWGDYKQYIVACVIGVVVVLAVGAFLIKGGSSHEITQDATPIDSDQIDDAGLSVNPEFASPLTGVECDRYNERPYAVMLSSDTVARPLSGIAEADVVVEMPVVQGGITRMMAVFVCDVPNKIGSIRSARNDFIPVAASLDVVYAHWGGEKQALDKLNKGILDNLNGLLLENITFERDLSIPRPHNGFTGHDKMETQSEKYGYNLEYSGPTYPHIQGESQHDENSILSIGYGVGSNVSYTYNPSTNKYARVRGGRAEIDKLTSQQVQTDNVVILVTNMRHDYEQYNKVDVTGSGDLYLAQNGVIVEGRWTKAETPLESKIFFYDENGDQIPFVAGKLWIQYVDKSTRITWAGERI